MASLGPLSGRQRAQEADVEESAETVPKCDSDELKFLHARSCQMCWKQTMPSKSAGEPSNVQETADFNSLYLMSDAAVRPSVEIFHRVTAADEAGHNWLYKKHALTWHHADIFVGDQALITAWILCCFVLRPSSHPHHHHHKLCLQKQGPPHYCVALKQQCLKWTTCRVCEDWGCWIFSYLSCLQPYLTLWSWDLFYCSILVFMLSKNSLIQQWCINMFRKLPPSYPNTPASHILPGLIYHAKVMMSGRLSRPKKRD